MHYYILFDFSIYIDVPNVEGIKLLNGGAHDFYWVDWGGFDDYGMKYLKKEFLVEFQIFQGFKTVVDNFFRVATALDSRFFLCHNLSIFHGTPDNHH